jgi:hypothetical protein
MSDDLQLQKVDPLSLNVDQNVPNGFGSRAVNVRKRSLERQVRPLAVTKSNLSLPRTHKLRRNLVDGLDAENVPQKVGSDLSTNTKEHRHAVLCQMKEMELLAGIEANK